MRLEMLTEGPEEYLSLPLFCRETSKRKSRKNIQSSSKVVRGYSVGLPKCSQCGGDVKIQVSPKRNPHSSKLGRTVALKDHDLCRDCWRRALKSSKGGAQYQEWYSPLSQAS